ncbi:PH domain-containing protein C19A8.02 [Apiospora marii]|uniref:PH domain-containing protein C19A8.02 n=1 Tax=Apiospora marii TaxID=335849 RepID=A0ABR1S549_9PEZI
MTNPHDAFKALAPIDFAEIDQNDPKSFLNDAFVDAQCIIDSIPGSIAAKQAQPPTGRPRSATDPTATRNADKATERAEKLRKEWKEVQLNPRDNPLGVSVYRLNAKDKKGAWFARRSVHQGLTFERWKLGMETEFAESLKVQGKPGDGKIRGIGADKRAVNQTIDGCGKMQVYQLSAQFPGPTTPREFITLLLTSDTAVDTPLQAKSRYFLVVSKPCTHPDCPPRNEYIRGQYESVELIREIKTPKPLRKVRSSIDLGKDEIEAERVATAEALSKEAVIRSARQAALASSASDVGEQEGRKRGKTIGFAGIEEDREVDDDSETSVEWLMVTRSDPGGSVPRFMKFLDWVTAMKVDDFPDHDEVSNQIKDQVAAVEEKVPLEQQKQALTQELAAPISHSQQDAHEATGSGGIYGMISNALGVAASVLPNSLPMPFGSVKGGDSDMSLSSSDLHDDTSSLHSFHSFASDAVSEKPALDGAALTPSISANTGDVQSTHSSESVAKSNAPSHSEKELRKLEQRREKVNQKLRRAQERALAKKEQEAQRDEATIAKLREKHEREVAKQEAKYRRDMQRLEDKKANEQRKAEERRRKALEREEKSNLAIELANVRAERDVALKQIDLLKDQVGELQSQNTQLVAKLGRQSKPDLARADTEVSQSTVKKAGVEAA